MNFEDEDISMLIKSNNVNIIFGLEIPLIYPYIFNMKNFIYSLTIKFKNNERKQRMFKIKNVDFDEKYELINLVQKQFNEKNIFNKEIKNIDEEDMEIFYNNYMTIFIFDNINGIKHSKEILEFIIEKKKKKKKLKKYEYIGEVFIWIETYKYLIIDIIKIINELFENNLGKLIFSVSEMIIERRNNYNDNDIDIDIINLEEPFYSIIEFLSYYVIKNNELFEEKIIILDYSCELLIQFIEELYIPSRKIFLLKNCIEVYKLLYEDKYKFEEYINEVNKEIENLKMSDKEGIEDMKNNWIN